VFAKVTTLNGFCAAVLEGFDESSSTSWMGLMKSPTEIETTYLIDNPQSSKWMKNYLADQKRLQAEYEKIVKDIKKKKLSPLAERMEIAKAVEKDRKMTQWVSNPISEKELPANYSRYMEGQSIRLSQTDAVKHLTALEKAMDDLLSGIISLKGSLETDSSAFGGLLEATNTINSIKTSIAVCKTGWANTLNTLVSGAGMTQRDAQRVVSKWVKTLRVLRNNCGMLLSSIQAASSILVMSKSKVAQHILAHSRVGTRDITHREFFVWVALYYKSSGITTLAESYSANGFESKAWAQDYMFKTENNKDFVSRSDKMDYPKWFEHIGWNYSHMSDLKAEDILLTSLDVTPKSKLSDIAITYVQTPNSDVHTLGA
jgi:hypothetical protein